jgi:hypothetical protein
MMVAGRGAELLRPATSSGRASFLELFFDLAFVFALTRVSQRFADAGGDAGWALAAGLGARLRLEYEIFGRTSRSRIIGVVALLPVTAALVRWAPMVGLSVVAGMLGLVALLDAVRSRRRPPEDPASPIGRDVPGAGGSEA